MKAATGIAWCAAAAALTLANVAAAATPDMQALAIQMRCNACHDASKTLIGPPWTSVAARYSIEKDKNKTVETLAQKIITGGGGSWGVVPMVPNEHVSLEDARALARWIVNLPLR
jgi:cytochrome c551/c552